MDKTKLYARHLLTVTLGMPDGLIWDLKIVEKSFKFGLLKLVDNPLLDEEKKQEILTKIFLNKIGVRSLEFIQLLVKENDLGDLRRIRKLYERLLKKKDAIAKIEIVTAKPLGVTTVSDIAVVIGKKMNGKLVISEKVDPAILGGIAIRINDKNYDNTLKRRVNDLTTKLTQEKV